MRSHHVMLAVLAGLVLVGVAPAASADGAGTRTLVAIRAAHHAGVDRLVFEFKGGLPALGRVGWSDTPPTLDPSGLPSHVQGNAFLTIVFQGATGYDPQGAMRTTYGPERRAYDLPNVTQVVSVGDWEAVLEFAVGVMHQPSRLHVTSLHDPARWVVDIGSAYPMRSVPVWFLDRDRIGGAPPSVTAVTRMVPASAAANGALLRLFAGPTIAERAEGLRFISSEATGFRGLRVNDAGVARVRLTGGCDGHGSTIATVATELMPTLRAFTDVDWVKILAPDGTTQQPWGASDSIPTCLEP